MSARNTSFSSQMQFCIPLFCLLLLITDIAGDYGLILHPEVVKSPVADFLGDHMCSLRFVSEENVHRYTLQVLCVGLIVFLATPQPCKCVACMFES